MIVQNISQNPILTSYNQAGVGVHHNQITYDNGYDINLLSDIRLTRYRQRRKLEILLIALFLTISLLR
jgi:hypothetical protein